MHKTHIHLLGQDCVGEIGRLHQRRQVCVIFTHLLDQVNPQFLLCVPCIALFKTHIRDHTQQIVLVSLVEFHGLIVGFGQ